MKNVSNLFFFCETLEDFNEAHLHEVTLNLHMLLNIIRTVENKGKLILTAYACVNFFLPLNSIS